MAISIVTYALSKRYTDDKIIHVSEDVIEEAVRQAKEYTDEVATEIEWKNVIVDELPPLSEADEHTIYFLPATTQPENDGYFEYIVIDNRWEVVGRTTVDLSNYYTKEEVDDYVGEYVEEHAYVLPAASSDELGGVRVDTNTIDLDNEGTISITTIEENDIQALFGGG